MRKAALIMALAVVGACIPPPAAEPPSTTPSPIRITEEHNPYAPRSEDLGKQIAGVMITSVNLSERLDLTPARVAVGILGSMPGVCNELRIIVEPPDEQYRIFIEVYSLVDPDTQCDNVFQQFEASILLGTYSSGRYTVWVNDALVGDFVTY